MMLDGRFQISSQDLHARQESCERINRTGAGDLQRAELRGAVDESIIRADMRLYRRVAVVKDVKVSVVIY